MFWGKNEVLRSGQVGKILEAQPAQISRGKNEVGDE